MKFMSISYQIMITKEIIINERQQYAIFSISAKTAVSDS